MRTSKTLATLAFALLAILPAVAAPTWLTDLDEAKKVAAKEKKDILVDFTGSDWCGWCIKLKKEVFDLPAFEAATKKFVLVELDFPSKKAQSDEVKTKNRAAQQKYGITGFPTILLMDAQGEVYARTGYQAGGPEKYVTPPPGALEEEHPGRQEGPRGRGQDRLRSQREARRRLRQDQGRHRSQGFRRR